MGTVKCPRDGKQYDRDSHCTQCKNLQCKHNPSLATLPSENISDRIKKFFDRVGLNNSEVQEFLRLLEDVNKTMEDYLQQFGLCRYCGNVIPSRHGPAELSKFDIVLCEKTQPNDKCHVIGIQCRNVRLGKELCRNLKPGASWSPKVTNKFMINGKLNLAKYKHMMKKDGVSHSGKSHRYEATRERYFFLLKYLLSKQPRTDKKFCSENCKAAYHLNSYSE